MDIKDFNIDSIDGLGIHWKQYLAMTLLSLLIFSIALDNAFSSFHQFILAILFKLECSGFNCNGVSISK